MKMMRKVMLLAAIMAVVLTAVSANAAPVAPVAWKHSNANSAARSATYLGVATGMDGTQTYLYNQDGVGGAGETAGADYKEFVTTSQTGPGWVGGLASCMTAQKVWIVIDLGESYDLGTVKIWNFNWKNGTSDLSNRGVKQFDVYVRDTVADTSDGLVGGTPINLNNTSWSGYLNLCASFNLGTSNQWVLALENQTLAQADNTDTHTSTSYNLSGHYGRFVAIVVDSYWNGAGCGLGKVRFEVSANHDPMSNETGVEINLSERTVPGSVSWLSPDDPDDPNIVQVFGYNLYMDPNQTKVINATPASTGLAFKSLQSGGQTGTSFDPGADLAYSTTYYWRVDAIVDYDTVPGTGIGDANTIPGPAWKFTTINQSPQNVVAVSAMVNNTGDDGVLTVTADTPPVGTLTYHWYLDYNPSSPGTSVLDLTTNPGKYPGAATASLTVKSVQPGYKLPVIGGGDENFYYCKVANSLGGDVISSNYARLAIKRLVSKYELDTEDNYTDSVGDWDGVKVGDPNLTTGYVGAGAHQFDAAYGDGVGINMAPTPTPGPWPSIGTQFTVTAWVWFDGSSSTSWKLIASNGDYYDTDPQKRIRLFDFGLSSENKLVLGTATGASVVDTTGAMSTGNWQFVAAVADGSKYHLYRMPAGLSEATRLSRRFEVASATYGGKILDPEKIPSYSGIGCRMATSGSALSGTPDLWNGRIDDVRVYNYGLTPEAVADLFGSSVCLYTGDWADFDFNNDCQVSLPDFVKIAEQWLADGIYP